MKFSLVNFSSVVRAFESSWRTLPRALVLFVEMAFNTQVPGFRYAHCSQGVHAPRLPVDRAREYVCVPNLSRIGVPRFLGTSKCQHSFCGFLHSPLSLLPQSVFFALSKNLFLHHCLSCFIFLY